MRASVCSRRIRSIAAFRAVVTIQAPGLRGAPSRGHRSRRPDEGVLHRVLGEVEITEDAAEDRDRARTLVAVGAGELLYDATSASRITIGRTSMWP